MILGEATVFSPDDSRVQQLMRNDERMRRLITDVGACELRLHQDAFTGLARPIVGQQLSGGAARSIWNRIGSAVGEISAENVLDAGEACLLSAGLSRNKTSYLLGIATAASRGELSIAPLEAQSDEQVLVQLRQFRGVGPWTAEMFLLFCLGRMDIFSAQDGGLRRAMASLYGWGADWPATAVLTATVDAWRPYRSIASLYLWKGLDVGVIG